MGRKLNGFTLAEVLITLVIIGVIAAMTIPSLMNKTNEQETVVAVKKAYSIISQAYQRVIAENGEINPSSLGSDDKEASKTLGKMFVKQLNTQKVCGQTSDGDCFGEGMYKFFNGDDWGDWNAKTEDGWYDYKIRLSDGMSVGIFGRFAYINVGNNDALQNCLGHISVDVNGNKGPNTLGKDVFQFWVTKYGILPIGTINDSLSFSTCRTTGQGCTAWVIAKGNVDYWSKDVSW